MQVASDEGFILPENDSDTEWFISEDSSDESAISSEEDSDEDFIIPVPENTHNQIISLRDSCLNATVTNLKRFIAAYHTSKDETLQRNILFLRRRYSTEIIQKFHRIDPSGLGFCSERDIQDSWRFLLNEYVQEFRFNERIQYHNKNKAVLVERIAEMGHALKIVHFDMGLLPDISFIHRCIPHLSNLNSLCIPKNCTKETLNIISTSCPKLEELCCQGPDCCDSEIFYHGGVKNLCAVENGAPVPNHTLKKLCLYSYRGWEPNVSESDVFFILENFKALENFNHPALPQLIYEIHKQDLSKNALSMVKYNITTINLLCKCMYLSLTLYEFLLACKDVCPHLKKLCTWIDDERELDLILLFPELKSLRIQRGSSEIDLNSFLKAKGKIRLKELTLRGISISVDVLIQNCPELEFLCLDAVKFQEHSKCEEVYQLNKLLKFRANDMGYIGIIEPIKSILNACTNIEELVLDKFKLKGLETLVYFSEFCVTRKSLQSITFSRCWIRPVLLCSIVMNCSLLKTLILKETVNENSFCDFDIFQFTPHKKHYVEVIVKKRDFLNYFFQNLKLVE